MQRRALKFEPGTDSSPAQPPQSLDLLGLDGDRRTSAGNSPPQPLSARVSKPQAQHSQLTEAISQVSPALHSSLHAFRVLQTMCLMRTFPQTRDAYEHASKCKLQMSSKVVVCGALQLPSAHTCSMCLLWCTAAAA